jgi:hypothetical protein
MESLKENLYYSTEENILFWVAGYTDNYHEVAEIKKMLDECVAEFELVIPTGVKIPIKTDYITESSRYKNMRYFYIKMDKKFVSKKAFELDKTWTMYSWLHN